MLELLSKIASQIFVYGTSIGFSNKNGRNGIQLKLKDFYIKDESSNSIIIENLSLYIENLIEEKDGVINFHDASYIVEKINFMIHEDWINKFLKNEEGLREQGIHNLRVNTSPEQITISGEYKVGIKLSFSIILKLTLDNGKIVIDLNRFVAGDFLPLPRWIQSTLLGILKKHLKSKKKSLPGISIEDRFITIDHLALIPVDCYLDITNIGSDEKLLVIQGRADKARSLKSIAEKITKDKIDRQRQKEEEQRKKLAEQLNRKRFRKQEMEDERIKREKAFNRKKLSDFGNVKSRDEIENRLKEMIEDGGETTGPVPYNEENSIVKITIDGVPPEEEKEDRVTIKV